MDDGATHGSAKLLAPIVSLGDAQLLINTVVGVSGRVEDVVVPIPVHSIRAAFRDRVHQAATRLSEFGFKSSAGDLKLPNHVLAELVGDAGPSDLLREEGIVVIATIHRVVVVVSGNAVEADHSEVAVGGGSGRQKREIRKIAPVQGKRLDTL